ncbi:hypothetical protein NZD89_00520 [Alicyclobacillus fastidiosus]|uniref:DUF4046 domain-containing protein n=1 Tax=Alicyclobacillus fastidiosus TaxID=392011 RepID=A0ABY6ZGR3_9BACL|nr:hypothetical protein [Alicyclobacillus fastidiosus]WAH42039.1 hypothetical protein NZD89_00520 [Alicyclobacillus fastidiosus]
MNYEHPIIHLYENILCHRIDGFSPYFFAGDEGKRNARIITRYVLQEKEHWNHEDICCGICRELLAEYRLAGMLKTYFQNSIFKVVENAYPGEFQPWELIKARKHVFVGETGRDMARKAVRWMVVDKLNYTLKDLHKITIKTFIDYKLGSVVNKIYRGSPWAAIQDAGFGPFHPWEIHQVPNGYWKGENGRIHAITATKWLIEEKLRIPVEAIPSSVRSLHFKQNGIETMLKDVFSGSPYQAIEAAYPGIFKCWQFPSVGNGYWGGSEGLTHAREAMEWLLFEKLNLEFHEIPYRVSRQTFRHYGLDNMLKQLFHGSVSKALNLIYPGQFTTEILQGAKRATLDKVN